MAGVIIDPERDYEYKVSKDSTLLKWSSLVETEEGVEFIAIKYFNKSVYLEIMKDGKVYTTPASSWIYGSRPWDRKESGRNSLYSEYPKGYCLYRFFNESGDLLYIGKTNNLVRRLCEYRNSDHTGCFEEAASVEYTELNPEDAHVLEPYLIITHKPLFNKEFQESGLTTFKLEEPKWLSLKWRK